jgi:hypothetical protein
MIQRIKKGRTSSAVGLMLCGLYISLCSLPLYVLHSATVLG